MRLLHRTYRLVSQHAVRQTDRNRGASHRTVEHRRGIHGNVRKIVRRKAERRAKGRVQDTGRELRPQVPYAAEEQAANAAGR